MKVCILDSDSTLTDALRRGLVERDIAAEHRRLPTDGDIDAETLSFDLIVLCQQDLNERGQAHQGCLADPNRHPAADCRHIKYYASGATRSNRRLRQKCTA